VDSRYPRWRPSGLRAAVPRQGVAVEVTLVAGMPRTRPPHSSGCRRKLMGRQRNPGSRRRHHQCRDVRRWDPAWRSTAHVPAARGGHGTGYSGQCGIEARFQRHCSRSAEHDERFCPGPRADPPACKTLPPLAPDATEPRVPRCPPPASRKGCNAADGTRSRPKAPSESANGSRSSEPLAKSQRCLH
jgi:hypothetical protein